MTRLQEATPPSGGTDISAAHVPGARAAPVGERSVHECEGGPFQPQAFEASFVRDPLRVRDMRRAANSFLRRSGVPTAAARDVELAVSELVTNAVVHGEGDVQLRITVGRSGVRVSVTDQSPVPAMLKDPGADAVSGRGMRLIDALADVWQSLGEETWCEFWYESDRGVG